MDEWKGADTGNCRGSLPPDVIIGLELFNKRQYFEAHEALEAAWLNEMDPLRELYRGILQVAIIYLHITRHNYPGAIKVYSRCLKWLQPWPDTCRGIAIGQLRQDLELAVINLQRLGPEHISEFDVSELKPVFYSPWDSDLPDR